MNIFIANLSFKVENEDLSQIFEEYGQVKSAVVIKDKFTGRSKGFGFVEMESEEEAKRAIEELNGAQFDGKEIAVSEARPRTEGGSRDSRGGGGGFNRGGGGGGFNRGGGSRGGSREGGYGDRGSRRY